MPTNAVSMGPYAEKTTKAHPDPTGVPVVGHFEFYGVLGRLLPPGTIRSVRLFGIPLVFIIEKLVKKELTL